MQNRSVLQQLLSGMGVGAVGGHLLGLIEFVHLQTMASLDIKVHEFTRRTFH